MKSAAVACPWLIPFAVFALTIAGPAPSSAVTVEVAVPGQADPWLAGMPDGSTASCHSGVCSVAPDQSPTHVPDLCLVAGESLTFEVTGGTAQHPNYPLLPPDGGYSTFHYAGVDNGMSSIVAPISSCLGVFLTNDQPDQSPAPPDLNFSTIESRNYLSLSPALKQVFFIGDGRTVDGVLQEVVIPAGATRLYLGTMDSWEWTNNIGELDARVTDPCGSTPATGACCFPAGVCLQGTQLDCLTVGGSYLGDGTLCIPNPCQPVAVERDTWGRVKASYR